MKPTPVKIWRMGDTRYRIVQLPDGAYCGYIERCGGWVPLGPQETLDVFMTYSLKPHFGWTQFKKVGGSTCE
jgi:hypothetical protein